MFPWLQSHYNFPFSGNVHQRIEPDWFFGNIDPGVGDGEIEKEVVLKVASYGRQIGLLTEVLLSLADERKADSNVLKGLEELKALQAKVEEVKLSKKDRLKENAKHILDKMKSSDPEGLKSLLDEYEKKVD